MRTDFAAHTMAAAGLSMDAFPADVAEMMKNSPALLAKDLADAVLYVLGTPPHVQIHEMIIKPVGENFVIGNNK